MAQKRKPSPLMGAAQAMLNDVSDAIVRDDSRFKHSMEVAMDRVQPDPEQPRKTFDEAELTKLARTMADQGQLQPILIRRYPEARGHWIIVAGERRWRAARMNGWQTILAIEHSGDSEVATLIENLQRVDLAAVEEARGLKRLLQQKGWSQTRAAQALGKTAPEISSILRILTLPEDLLEELLAPKDSAPSRYVLAELARVEEGATRDRLILAARQGNLTQKMVRDARDAASNTAVDQGDSARRTLLGSHLSAKSIQTFCNRLREMGAQRERLQPQERKSLEHLRREIDEILDSSEKTLVA